MATKLKNLKVTKVDFVDEGANPDAHILLFKNREGAGNPTDGTDGKGGVLKKLFSLLGKAAGVGQDEIDAAVEELKKGDAFSFNEKLSEADNRKIADEMWDVCFALQSSLCSILNDGELDGAGAAQAMQESLDEFYSLAKESVAEWSSGKTKGVVSKREALSESGLAAMQSAVERLNGFIEKAGKGAEPGEKTTDSGKKKGEQEMGMKIDKSRMSPAELAFYESIEKRYGTEETGGAEGTAAEPPQGSGEQDANGAPVTKAAVQGADGTPVAKAAQERNASVADPAAQPAGQEADDIYKGLHPAVKAELEELKKFREAAEDKELMAVAGKYAIIGKKAEELAPVLKSLKAAGGSAYSDYIAVLDEAADIVEKSGAFSEIGRSGHGDFAGGAWAEADVKASELMKSKEGLTKAQALDEVLMSDPALAERCEKEG